MRDGDLGAGLVGFLFVMAVMLLLSGMGWAARAFWRWLTESGPEWAGTEDEGPTAT
jgi:hypothetical protein